MTERPPDEPGGRRASGEAQPSRPPADPPRNGGDDDDEGVPGWFPSWGALYATVIVYTAALTFLLWVFSVTLDYGAP